MKEKRDKKKKRPRRELSLENRDREGDQTDHQNEDSSFSFML
jgi:hypothetical protein